MISGVTFHVEEVMTWLVLETLTVEHKRVGNYLSAALESLIKHIVWNVMKSPQTISKVTKSAIQNHAFAAGACQVGRIKTH